MDDSRVRSVFENGLVWMGPQTIRKMTDICKQYVKKVDFDRMLLETASCKVSNETAGSKWSQNATLDFYTTVLASLLR